MAARRKVKPHRNKLRQFASKKPTRRKRPKPFIPDPWYFTPDAAAFFSQAPRRAAPDIDEEEEGEPEPLAPIISEVGSGFEDEFEFDDAERKAGEFSKYLQRYIYDRDDFDEDQDDPYDF